MARGKQPLVTRGHPLGDLVEAWRWSVIEHTGSRLRVQAVLPGCLKNERGVMRGDAASAYLDFLAILLFQQARRPHEPTGQLVTASLRVEFFAGVHGPEFEIDTELLHQAPSFGHVEARFLDGAGQLAILGHATIVRRFAAEEGPGADSFPRV